MNKILKSLKKILRGIIAVILNILFLDFFLAVFSKIVYFIAKLIYIRDWNFYFTHVPQFFNHHININRWRFEPQRWSFTARGVYARENMTPGCKVLDLCCGDGTHSFLFFSDICGHIDAIDNDQSALSFANKYNKHPKLNFKKVDIITEAFPSDNYDIVVWNAGICYFSQENINLILNKIVNSGKLEMILCGMLPQANGHIDHITEFSTLAEVKTILNVFFADVSVREIIEDGSITFYFKAANPTISTINANY